MRIGDLLERALPCESWKDDAFANLYVETFCGLPSTEAKILFVGKQKDLIMENGLCPTKLALIFTLSGAWNG